MVDAVVNSPKYNRTVLIISFDETGGWGDHVVPFHSHSWRMDRQSLHQQSHIRWTRLQTSFVVVSPWTRGGNVFTEPADHISQNLFLEAWAEARGTPFRSAEINDWRREHMSNLTSIFDWDNPDTSPVELPFAETPHSDLLTSMLDGPQNCERLFGDTIQPPIPYGNQTEEDSLVTEQGFKSVRGALTEGRYLVIESNDSTLALAISTDNTTFIASPASETKFDVPSQRFVIHATDPTVASANTFKISAGADFDGLSSMYITSNLTLGTKDEAAVFDITFLGVTEGYVFEESGSGSGRFLGMTSDGKVGLGDEAVGMKIFAVSF
ncbi:hypothetical protein D9758_015423 [Tetrapyrgos nigripes]|uniref:Non-hemolytic phospholipase C n=1 Tax=Tetrapyrgos nigripes TaxID=182062 RepID=A0A8H5FNS8_9AGAR|nr:hypothetical protein D9758_015423 [Tetrapyrgos nigripes]